jgi:hypothetical protein
MILSVLTFLAVQLAPEDVARAKTGEQLGRDLLEQGGCVILEGPPGKPTPTTRSSSSTTRPSPGRRWARCIASRTPISAARRS